MSHMEVDSGEAKPETAEAPATVTLEGGSFDLQSKIENHSGVAKIARLLFIIKRCPELVNEALPAVIAELTQGQNTAQYNQIFVEHVAALGSLGIAKDEDWIMSVDKQAEITQGKLENQLSVAQKSGTSKEATRVAHTNLGDFWFDRGDVSAALKCYTRARDYCSTPELTRLWCLNVIKCHIANEQFHSIASYVAKAENQESAERRGPVETSKLKVCSALAHMHSRSTGKDHKNFRFAAKAFLAVSAQMGDAFNTVVAPEDVAIYGGLCALATLDRAELNTGVVKNAAFKQFLEKVPEMNEILLDFKNSRYASMLKHMEVLKTSALLDLHMARHVETLYRLIRNRAMVQYFTPYSAVNLHQMAVAFDRDVATLEKELSTLISEGLISARIDSHNKVLKARSVNTRSSTFKAALETGTKVAKESDAMLLRASVMRNHLVVAAPKDSKRQAAASGEHPVVGGMSSPN